ncbi:MAG TPA: site-specific integrase, partial [Candidatus Saccharimonadales bacterium]|nr:site-specific integrase [Candidatus Saccharimonadales bacterium]
MEFILKFKNYLLSLKPSPSKVTVKNYVADVKHFVFWYEKAFSKTFDPKSISLVTIEQFRKEKGTDLSASSLDRHISSLRKFFQALKMQSIISSSPFELPQSPKKPEDTYHLKEFKDFLYVYNASRLTIKNYLIDVKQFLSWAETVTQAKESWNVADKNVFTHINDALVAEYRERLLS